MASLAQMAADLDATATAYGAPLSEARVFSDLIRGIPPTASTKIIIDTLEAQKAVDDLIAKMAVVDPATAERLFLSRKMQTAQQQLAQVPTVGHVTPPPPSGHSGTDQALQRAQEQAQKVDNLHEHGLMSDKQYVASLSAQMAKLAPWTDEWSALYDKRAQVAADSVKRVQQAEDTQFEEGRISAANYIALLQKRAVDEATIHGYDSAEAKAYRDKIVSIQKGQLADERELAEAQYAAGLVSSSRYLAVLVEAVGS